MLGSSFVLVFLYFISLIVTESIYKAHVINLPKRTDRLASIKKQLNENEIPFEVFSAITPEDIEAEASAKRNNETSTGRFQPETKLNFHIRNFGRLKKTEVGCLQSHLQVLLQIVKSNTTSPVLIVEDDAVLLPNFYNRTVDIMKMLPLNWDVFHVGYCWEAKCDNNGPKGKDFCKIRRSLLYCTQAYFVNGSKAAELATNVLNTPMPGGQLDEILYKTSPSYFASLPKLAKQAYAFGSDNGNGMSHWRLE